MRNSVKLLVIGMMLLAVAACSPVQQPDSNNSDSGQRQQNQTENNSASQQAKKGEVTEKENTSNVKYNEMGKVMVLMYHQLVEKETNEWTRSFDNFKKDLETLYDKGYRPINLRDYINGNIDVPAGYTPVIFTFDDGTSGQFNLIQKDRSLDANPKSAVGIMEEFNKTHPDFPLKGTFFINHTGFFHGQGTLQERLKYLADKGFEVGNHTINHPSLNKITSAKGIEKEIGGHVKRTMEMLPGYVEDELALPMGITSKKFPEYVEKGEFEGVKYQNKVILLVGSNPALSVIDNKVNFLQFPRIRARGNKPVELDMYYWLNYFDKNPSERFISDGNKEIFTIPVKYKERVNTQLNKNIVFLK